MIKFELPVEINKYAPTEQQLDQVRRSFTYHPPKPDMVPRFEAIRLIAHELALVMTSSCPQSRELSVALTHLQNSVMMANAAIACNEK